MVRRLQKQREHQTQNLPIALKNDDARCLGNKERVWIFIADEKNAVKQMELTFSNKLKKGDGI